MQLKYGEMDVALVGQIADLSNKTIDSFAAEEALDPGSSDILAALSRSLE